ncbi:sulfotransferase family protein [Thauera aromatica]|uniref:sulfotransferase family protein n=1 Tax=Thauera aromatica TaxID=59405 RepID=UPI001FFCB008|nr:hypothetical protein [Thauera aromatica]MCK2097509.1 hypothetical protein [Thauera aromatica]
MTDYVCAGLDNFVMEEGENSLSTSPINQKKSMVVLGMHRSGTSATAGLFSLLGFDTGRVTLPGNRFNPKGYFEDALVVRENDHVLEQLNRSWFDTRSLPLNWLDFDSTEASYLKQLDVFKAEYQINGQWVLKDPRICRLLPLWKKIFASLPLSPGYLFVVRNPVEVAASLQSRDGLPVNKALLLYSQYLLEAEKETRGHLRSCIRYDDLLRDWRATLKWVIERLSLDLAFPDEEDAQKIDQFITPSLKHERAKEPSHIDLDGKEWAIAEAVYQSLSQPEPFADEARFDALREQLLHYSLCRAELITQHYVEHLQTELISTNEALDEDLSWMAKSVLYWKTHAYPSYHESRLIYQPFYFGAAQSLRFEFSELIQGYEGLRWDVTDRAAFCTVQQAWLENPLGEHMWTWTPTEPLFGPPSADMMLVRHPKQADYGVVLATGGDPHAPLLIPADVLRQIAQGWAFCATVSFALPTLAIPRLIEIMRTAGSVAAAHTAPSPVPVPSDLCVPPLSRHAQDVANLLKVTLTDRDRDLYSKQQQLDQLREELLRAEAQLDMLKDLLLDQMGNERL